MLKMIFKKTNRLLSNHPLISNVSAYLLYFAGSSAIGYSISNVDLPVGICGLVNIVLGTCLLFLNR